MKDFFQENLAKIQAIFPDPEKQNEIKLINENIYVEVDEEHSDMIFLPSGTALANLQSKSITEWKQSIENPVRFITPEFSFTESRYSDVNHAFSAAIDVDDRPILEYLLRQKSDSAPHEPFAPKPTYIVFGFLNLISLIEIIDELPDFSSILVIEHSLERIVCALKFFSLDYLLEKIKSRASGFSIVYEEKADSLVAAFQKHILNLSPSVVYNMHLISPVVPSAVLTRFQGWLESPQGGKAIVELLFGNETDEINQLLNCFLNSNNSQDVKYLNTNFNRENADRESKESGSIILTASGPSLDDNISFLKSISSTSTIVAAGSSIGTLLRNGIKPTAVVLLEMASVVYYDILQLVSEGFDLSDIILIGSFSIDPRIKKLFNSFFAFSRPSVCSTTILDDESGKSLLPQAGPQVANAALEVVLSLGYKHLHFCGCDFASLSADHSRSRDAVGHSFRDLNIPAESRGKGTVFTDAELMITAQFFSEMLSRYDVQATTCGNGIPLKNTTYIDNDIDLNLLESNYFRERLNQSSFEYDASRHHIDLVSKVNNAADQIHAEIVNAIESYSCWSRDLQNILDSYLVFQRPQDESAEYKLYLRCYRSLLFKLFRSLAVDCDEQSFLRIKNNTLLSLHELKLGSANFFHSLFLIISNPVMIQMYDPKMISSILLK